MIGLIVSMAKMLEQVEKIGDEFFDIYNVRIASIPISFDVSTEEEFEKIRKAIEDSDFLYYRVKCECKFSTEIEIRYAMNDKFLCRISYYKERF